MFKPKVVLNPLNDGLYSVRKLGIRGWKYLDLWNYKSWHYCSYHNRVPWITWRRIAGSKQRAEMALVFNQNPPPL